MCVEYSHSSLFTMSFSLFHPPVAHSKEQLHGAAIIEHVKQRLLLDKQLIGDWATKMELLYHFFYNYDPSETFHSTAATNCDLVKRLAVSINSDQFLATQPYIHKKGWLIGFKYISNHMLLDNLPAIFCREGSIGRISTIPGEINHIGMKELLLKHSFVGRRYLVNHGKDGRGTAFGQAFRKLWRRKVCYEMRRDVMRSDEKGDEKG